MLMNVSTGMDGVGNRARIPWASDWHGPNKNRFSQRHGCPHWEGLTDGIVIVRKEAVPSTLEASIM